MGYSNSKSVSTCAFGIPTNLYSVHGSIKVTQSQVGREERGACARCMGGEAKAPRVASLCSLNQCLELVPSICHALHDDGADDPTSCDWLIPGLVREPVLYPELSALPSASRFIRQSLQKILPTLSTTSSNACNSIL